MRLFVALDIPGEVRSAIGELAAKLRAACPVARWVRMEGLHVTLKFIGETPTENAEKIKAALAVIPSRASIPIHFRGLGFFPNKRWPRVLWAGVECGAELATLAADVDTSLHALGIPLGTARDMPQVERAFSPHLTLARFSEPLGLDTLHPAIEKAGQPDFGGTVAKEFCLYQSVLKPGGAEYTRLATFSFTEKRTA